MAKGQPPAARTEAALADAKDLRETITLAIATQPILKRQLRAAVWNYVGNERRAGLSPSDIIADLTAVVDASEVRPLAVRQEVTRQVILWCVEEYFGHLGGNPLRRGGSSSGVPSPA